MSLLSERLRELRGPSSQKEMASAVGIKWNAWARYERGEVSPGAEILANICRVHCVSADWLLGLKDNCCVGRNISARAGTGGIAIAGSGNRVSRLHVVSACQAGVVAGAPTTSACAKCPYKKKLKALEKLLNK